VDIQRAAVDAAKLVIAEVNPNMPRTFGASTIHLKEIDFCVESDLPVLELAPQEPDEAAKRIGSFVARLVPNGSCLQAGIGGIPAAVLRSLYDKRDLGVHTEMFTDDLLPLIENGNVTNRRKSVHPRVTVSSFAMGSRRLYDALDDNPGFAFYDSRFVNDPRIIAQNDQVVAINSALQVDLTGQVCADSMGYRFYSGIGGQVDFIRGAAMSRGGRPIIALPSTAKEGSVSRIVPRLDEGAGVVTSRGDVHYVVTEYGVAYLHGKTIRERALALIQIAHPDFRQELLDFTREWTYVDVPEALWQQLANPYPAELEQQRDFGTLSTTVRPLKPTDERLLQEFFYSHDPQTIYNRHHASKKRMSLQEAAALCTVDYDRRMAFGVFSEEHAPEGSRLIGVARYARDAEGDGAETAVVVHQAHRRLGIARYLMNQLQEYAEKRGIRSFHSEVLPGNTAMVELRKSMGSSMHWDHEAGVIEMTQNFETIRRTSLAPPSRSGRAAKNGQS
jgi:ribosomal protein S18 acetylase RimI-like enzyme/acyl CoA:acetate/3-ketoacid CoA transferase beta subunit